MASEKTLFLRRVEALCADSNMTTTDLGLAAGIGNGTITGWRKGSAPRISTVAKVATFFNVPVAYLTGETDDPIDYKNMDTSGFSRPVYDNILKKCYGNVEQANREYLERELAQAMSALSATEILSRSDAPVSTKSVPTAVDDNLTSAARRVGRAYDKAPQRDQGIVEYILEPYIDEQVIYVEFSQSEQKASAGTGVFLSDESMVTLSVRLDALPDGYERHPERYFGVPVSGDSMEPKYHDGDILIVSKEPLNMGDIGIVIMDGEGYVKKIGSGVLCSLNPAYDDIPITESVYFSGKVVGTLNPEWIK